jgi:hypothetical protein
MLNSTSVMGVEGGVIDRGGGVKPHARAHVTHPLGQSVGVGRGAN